MNYVNQGALVFELPPQVRAAIAACELLGLDPIGATAAAFHAYESGRAPLAAASTAEVSTAGEPVRKARAGRRAGFDAAFAGSPA